MPVRYLGDSIVDVGGPPSVIQELGAVLADIEECNQFFYFHIFSSLTSRLKQDIICKSLGFFLRFSGSALPWVAARAGHFFNFRSGPSLPDHLAPPAGPLPPPPGGALLP